MTLWALGHGPCCAVICFGHSQCHFECKSQHPARFAIDISMEFLCYNGHNECNFMLPFTGNSNFDCVCYFLAATKQLYEWFSPSVRLSVTPFWLCSHHRIITKFSGVITNDKSDVHANKQGQRSKVKVTEVKKSSNLTQIGRFRTVTPVWIHQWLRNGEQSLK